MWFSTELTPGTLRTASTQALRIESFATVPHRWTTPREMTTSDRRACDQFCR
jgi:hypothetical protein